jgi:hypothetical protein
MSPKFRLNGRLRAQTSNPDLEILLGVSLLLPSNCAMDFNPDQKDSDSDGFGDE